MADDIAAAALNVLLIYLAGSSASVLENVIVEKEQIASAVYYATDYRPDTVLTFTLSSVATEKLSEVEGRLHELLRETAAKSLDMDYMLDCVRRQKRQMKLYAESSGSFFTDSIINDFLFGNRDGSTLRTLGSLKEYDELESWTDGQWRQFLKTWISNAPHISILGVPSAKLSRKIKSDEKARVAKQKKDLGAEGLKKLEEKLAEAKAGNDKEIPRGLLEKFIVPSTDSIHFIHTTTARSGVARRPERLDNKIQNIVDEDHSDLPLFIHFEHIPTNFVHLSLVISTGSVPVPLRPLLSLYLDNFFNTPIMRDGKRIEFEQVVIELEKDTVGYTIESGSSISNPEVLRVRFQVELEKYETAIRWLKEMLWQSIFDETVSNACHAETLHLTFNRDSRRQQQSFWQMSQKRSGVVTASASPSLEVRHEI